MPLRKTKRRIGLLQDPAPILTIQPPPPVPHKVLQINGLLDFDDYTPALYYVFTPTADVWARVTRRTDIPGTAFGNQPLFVLGWTEWTTDQAYYGDWWRTGGVALWTGGGSVPANGNAWNVSSTGTGGPTGLFGTPSSDGHEIYDVRAHVTGFTTIGAGHYRVAFDTEGWHNGVKEDALSLSTDVDPGKPAYATFNSLVIFNRYAESGKLHLDDIMVGTSRGANDLMPKQTFDDGTFGDFTLDDGDTSGMVDSFEVIDAAA